MKKAICTIVFSLLVLYGLSVTDKVSADTYSVGFENSHIRVTSPRSSGIECDGTLSLTGSSDLDQVCFGLRGPNNEIIGFQTKVVDGSFNCETKLRFGSGQYTVWAGSNPQTFDGSIRFQVHNRVSSDTRYTSASQYVDSESPEILELAQTLAPAGLDDMQKLRQIHDWVAGNISFDCEAYASGENRVVPASQVLQDRTGMCRDYAILLAALARASGLPTKVVYGEATQDEDSRSGLHAWNEVMVNGQWVNVDSCWDAGYVKGNQFIAEPSSRFFAPDAGSFKKTHAITQAALF